MAHAISTVSGRPEIAYSGSTPWHGLGTKFENLMTSAEAFQAAGLDWKVEKRPAFFTANDGTQTPIPGCFATVRGDTERPLGFVGSSYEPIQNAAAFDFMDAVVLEGGVKYEVAGALHGGEVVWLLAKLPTFTTVAHDDVSNHYLLFTNNHDGRRAATVGYTAVRVVCQNTLRIANPKHRFKIRHSGSIESKLNDARTVLGLATEAFEEYTDAARRMSFRSLNKTMIEQFKLALMGVKAAEDMTKKNRADWQRIEDLMETGMGTDLSGVKGTVWGMVNAVTEFVDHERPRREVEGYDNDELRMSMNTWGNGDALKQRAWELALATV